MAHSVDKRVLKEVLLGVSVGHGQCWALTGMTNTRALTPGGAMAGPCLQSQDGPLQPAHQPGAFSASPFLSLLGKTPEAPHVTLALTQLGKSPAVWLWVDLGGGSLPRPTSPGPLESAMVGIRGPSSIRCSALGCPGQDPPPPVVDVLCWTVSPACRRPQTGTCENGVFHSKGGFHRGS